jgi:hypothetical protein
MSSSASVSATFARAIDAVRVNRCWRANRDGQAVWIKQRRRWADPVILAGNLFLIASNSRIRMFPSVARWREWELESFNLVNGDRFACGEYGIRAVWFGEVPGISLRERASVASFAAADHRAAVVAAARELARVHRLICPIRGTAWSHGDPHLGNVLYDAGTDRARLIDFETAHEPRLPATHRHADDLLTFLLELLARSAPGAWPDLGVSFLRAYGDRRVITILSRRLIPPIGLHRVLWRTRTDHLPSDVVATRVAQLRHALANEQVTV